MTWALVKPAAGYKTLSRLLRLSFLPSISTSERLGMGVGLRLPHICCQSGQATANRDRLEAELSQRRVVPRHQRLDGRRRHKSAYQLLDRAAVPGGAGSPVS